MPASLSALRRGCVVWISCNGQGPSGVIVAAPPSRNDSIPQVGRHRRWHDDDVRGILISRMSGDGLSRPEIQSLIRSDVEHLCGGRWYGRLRAFGIEGLY